MTEQMMQMSEEMALEELTTEKELRRRELEQAFGSYNFVVVRKELFVHLRDPAVTIRKGSITFNTACINGLEDVVFVQLLQSFDFSYIGRNVLAGQAPVVFDPYVRVRRKAQCMKTMIDRGEDHFFRRRTSVAELGMRMRVRTNQHSISPFRFS